MLTESTDPGAYWRQLKKRILTDEGTPEIVTNCHKLKMRALDGKLHATDAANVETLLRIVQSVLSPKAEPMKFWLARVGAECLEEVADALAEDQHRILMCGEVAEKNTSLARAAPSAGVLSKRDFAIFHVIGSCDELKVDGLEKSSYSARRG